MYEDVLREIGLSQNEAKVYESMLGIIEINADQIALKAGIHRRNVYDTLARLIEKGLVSEIFLENRKFYRAIEPTRLSDILSEKQARINAILPSLEKKFAHGVPDERAYIYKGIQGFKNYLKDIINEGKDGYFMAAKGGWFDERLKYIIPKFMQESKELGLNYYHLFDYEMKEKMPEIFKQRGFIYKMLPKGYSTTSATDIFGDHVVIFTGLGIGRLSDDISQFIMVSKGLANDYRTWFKTVWDLLPGKKFSEVKNKKY